ncbi:hypothetical protein ASF58_23515 [Methylobacterium sp. Leaf125]|jgi:hypothetical protein|uniref:hypothetical protein n=1 Tax=Methylobacterium sp. Leaf125 TaxID=1736265 RepID=UPI0006F540EB|nr:hypothetical protein [Methylobacterium sp. Leaf125]KQQ37539.1 hypothetical protein ASF58_23515 [Methylobacterium sp. Leaf125]
MREANYALSLEGTPSYTVLYGVARGLEDLFPIIEYPRFSDSEDEALPQAEENADETDQVVYRVG